jgi:hypothetical protein
MDGEDLPFGLDGMDTSWLTKLKEFGVAIVDAFLWPGTFITTRLVELAPALAPKLGIDADGTGILLTAALSLLAWALLFYLVWKVIKSVGLFIYYNLSLSVFSFITTFSSSEHSSSVRSKGIKRVPWSKQRLKP